MVETSVAAPGREKLADGDPHREQGRAVERVLELLAVPARKDEPGAFEDVEVVGHRRRGEVEARRECAGGLFTVAEEADYLSPSRVGEGLEGQIDLLIARILSHTSNHTPPIGPCLGLACVGLRVRFANPGLLPAAPFAFGRHPERTTPISSL